jgi:hypothetical protein
MRRFHYRVSDKLYQPRTFSHLRVDPYQRYHHYEPFGITKFVNYSSMHMLSKPAAERCGDHGMRWTRRTSRGVGQWTVAKEEPCDWNGLMAHEQDGNSWKKHSTEFEAKVALEAARDGRTVSELATTWRCATRSPCPDRVSRREPCLRAAALAGRMSGHLLRGGTEST